MKGAFEFGYDIADPSSEERDAWLANDQLPVTHIVRYRPEFVIQVKLPPWVDPDLWLAEASMGWNDMLTDAGEPWTEAAGYAFMEIANEGSSQEMSAAPAVGCCAECAHYGHSVCIVCGMPDAECMAILWPETVGIR